MVAAELRLQALHARYRTSLSNKRAGVELAWRALCAESSDPARLESLMRLVHRLAGSAPSYGYQEIGDIAARTDATIEQYRQSLRRASAGEDGQGIVDGLMPLVTRLLQAIDRAMNEPVHSHGEFLTSQS